MTKDTETETIVAPSETTQPITEESDPTDDVTAVQFGDPALMGDEFLAMAEEALTCGTKRELTYWIAEQLRDLKAWKQTAKELIAASATWQRKREVLRRAIVELTSQTPNNSTIR